MVIELFAWDEQVVSACILANAWCPLNGADI